MPVDWYDQPDDAWDDESYADEDSRHLTETVPCPHCGADIYEDAVRCPACGTYVTHTTSPWVGRPVWWIVLALLGVLATVCALAGLCPW
jgi:endogenous inhibitor of DNA gyrase (YacG/DUF329 family)